MKRILFIMGCLATPALAQQQAPDPAVLQRAVAVIQAQRNQALDVAASADVRAAGLADELAKAQAKLKELKQKAEPAPAAKKH
jgi:Skp family chaperone for outer membrane proteins